MKQDFNIRFKIILIVFGVLFTTFLFGQTKTDAELYAIWKDKSEPDTVRLEAIWERVNFDSMPNHEPDWWKKWNKELKEAIELAIKNNKTGYLPLLYMMSTIDCAGNIECMCSTAKKVLESSKVANDSRWPFALYAYHDFNGPMQ
ncbi:MAG: hypothetical protein IPI60_09910 [Saprospiraceae bacterium]|nr:hypothetical protein [Saprospiraceae bacterium]